MVRDGAPRQPTCRPTDLPTDRRPADLPTDLPAGRRCTWFPRHWLAPC